MMRRITVLIVVCAIAASSVASAKRDKVDERPGASCGVSVDNVVVQSVRAQP